MGFHLPGCVGVELELTGEDLVDPPAKGRPVVLLDLEVSSQIEQGALTYFGADSFGANEAMGEVRLAGVGATGLGAADEHRGTVARGALRCNTYRIFYGTTSAPPPSINHLRSKNRPIRGKSRPITAPKGKVGLGIKRSTGFIGIS